MVCDPYFPLPQYRSFHSAMSVLRLKFGTNTASIGSFVFGEDFLCFIQSSMADFL